jgi:predicted ATPase
MLKQNFALDVNDSDANLRQKVEAGLTALGIDLETTAPYLLHLLAPNVAVNLPASMPPEAVKYRIFEALRLLTLAGATRRPVVLAIEDLHWVDKTTEAFLTFLLDHIAGARVLLVCTYRPDFVSTWSRKSYHHAISLTRLVQYDSYQMLLALLGTTQVQDALAQLILDKAEGVPFFLEELVKSLQETAAIELHAGTWQLTTEATTLHVPDTVEEVLMARIDRLPEEAKQVLQLCAVIGREVSWELLKEVAALPEWELLAHMRALTDAELLYERGFVTQTTYIFKHALTQEAAYRSLLTARRRVLHQRVAVTLETLFPDRLEEHAGQLAYHFGESTQADELAKAMVYARRAGERHMILLAYAEAARFFQMALQALERQEPVDAAQRCALLLALGEAQRKAGERQQALATLQQAANSARVLRAADSLAQAAIEYEQAIWVSEFPAAPAVCLLEDALQALPEEDSALRARTLTHLARVLFRSGQHRAIAYSQQAVAMGRRLGDPTVLAVNLLAILPLLGLAHSDERLAYATEMLRLAEAASDTELMREAQGWLVICALERGDVEAFNTALAAEAELVNELKMPYHLYEHLFHQTLGALFEGRFVEAEQLAVQTRNMAQSLQGIDADGIFGLHMFIIRREQGRLKELESVIRYFVQQHSAASTWRPGLALIYSELEREREARALFESLAQHDFADVPQDALWMVCMTYLAEVCTFLGDTERAATLYRLLRPYAARNAMVNEAACYGCVSRYLGMLATTMAQWDEAEQHFEEALVMNARISARPWLAHTQHQYAVMLQRRNQPGDHEKALSLLDGALLTARALGMRTLEERVSTCMQQPATLGTPTPSYLDDLSQRELDVLRLIVAGKSNRDIADTLFISLSTVASHVRHILTKTNTTNRTEAAAYAIQHGLSPQP